MTRHSSRRVLVVDDHPDSADIACTLLALYGHDARYATSGTLALELARTFDPDVAILDIGLPDISGYEVARELRRRAGARPLYLAAITGWGQTEDRALAYAAGFDQHVLKPANGEKLRDIMERAIRASSTEQPHPRA